MSRGAVSGEHATQKAKVRPAPAFSMLNFPKERKPRPKALTKREKEDIAVGKLERSARRTSAEYLDLFRHVVPPERMAKIIETAAQDAESGDDKARTFLARYCIGDPERLHQATPEEEVRDAAAVIHDMRAFSLEERNEMLRRIAEERKRLTEKDPSKQSE